MTNTRAGTVKAHRRAKLSPQIGGRVVELPFRKGAAVPAGALLLRLDDSVQAAQVRLADEQVKAAESQARQACLAAGLAERELTPRAGAGRRRDREPAEPGLPAERPRPDAGGMPGRRGRARRGARPGRRRPGGARPHRRARPVLGCPGRLQHRGRRVDHAVAAGRADPRGARPHRPGLGVRLGADRRGGLGTGAGGAGGAGHGRLAAGREARRPAGRGSRRTCSTSCEQNRTVEIEVELADAAVAAGLLPGTSADVEVDPGAPRRRAAGPDRGDRRGREGPGAEGRPSRGAHDHDRDAQLAVHRGALRPRGRRAGRDRARLRRRSSRAPGRGRRGRRDPARGRLADLQGGRERGARPQGRQPRDRPRRARRADRALRLRQVHAAAHRRLPRPPDARALPARGARGRLALGGGALAAAAAPDRLRVPVLPPAAAPLGARQRRAADALRRDAGRGAAGAGGGRARRRGARAPGGAPARPALGRRAAARRHRPRGGDGPGGVARRRAHRQPGPRLGARGDGADRGDEPARAHAGRRHPRPRDRRARAPRGPHGRRRDTGRPGTGRRAPGNDPGLSGARSPDPGPRDRG